MQPNPIELPEGPLPSRVAALEVGVRTLSKEVESVQTSVDRLGMQVVSGFSEMRRDSANSGRTNWGWIFAAVGILVAIIGAVGTAWVRPIEQQTASLEARLTKVEKYEHDSVDRLARIEERARIYQELGIIQSLARESLRNQAP